MLYVSSLKQAIRPSAIWALLLISPLLITTSSLAADFNSDFGFFRNALRVSNFSDSRLEDFTDPYVGKNHFRLDGSSAPWAGNYFPMEDGGIANRWQVDNKRLLNVEHKPTKESLLNMNQARINSFSPAEKFDIMMGDYNFSASIHELLRRGPLRDIKPENWEGFCNGVRCAGILLPEPTNTVTITNIDGIKVEFQPADLKALAGASYFYVERYAQLGAPTQSGLAQAQANAAIFDLALRYFLAEKKQAFVFDSHLGSEIWNESAIGYSRTLYPSKDLNPKETALYPKANKKIRVRLELESLAEVDIKKSNQATKKAVAAGDLHDTIHLEYTLYLNKAGKTVDGAWINRPGKTRGVDFVWFGGGKGTDTKYIENSGNPYLDFDTLKKIFNDASKPICKSLFL